MIKIKNIHGYSELVNPYQVVKIFSKKHRDTGDYFQHIETVTGRFIETYEEIESLQERLKV